MLLRQAIEEYLTWKGAETRTAAKVYRPFLEHFYNFVGNKDTLEIKLEEISQFRASLKLKRLVSANRPFSIEMKREKFNWQSNLRKGKNTKRQLPTDQKGPVWRNCGQNMEATGA